MFCTNDIKVHIYKHEVRSILGVNPLSSTELCQEGIGPLDDTTVPNSLQHYRQSEDTDETSKEQ